MLDLETMSRQELMSLRANLDKAISTAGERDRRKALQAAEDAVRAHGFTLADVAQLAGAGARGSRRTKTERAAEDRNPDVFCLTQMSASRQSGQLELTLLCSNVPSWRPEPSHAPHHYDQPRVQPGRGARQTRGDQGSCVHH